MRQEVQQFIAVHDKNLLHSNRLVGIRDEDFENVEAFVLHHLAIVSEEVHADLEVLAAVDVGDHDAVVGAVEENFTEEFD